MSHENYMKPGSETVNELKARIAELKAALRYYEDQADAMRELLIENNELKARIAELKAARDQLRRFIEKEWGLPEPRIEDAFIEHPAQGEKADETG